MSQIISIVKLEDASDIYKAVEKGFELMGAPNFEKTDTFVIKPNLCCIKGPETGATTDPRVVRAIISYLRNNYGISDISIVESDGTQVLADMAFKLLGYAKLSKELNVKLVNLSKAPSSSIFLKDNHFVKKISMPHIIENADHIVSVPKIKMHTLCSFGGAMKNQFGCNPYPKKKIYHKRMDDAIVDISMAFKADLVIVDGLVTMEGCGPVDGIPVRLNSLIFGRDVVAVDHLISRIIGVNPKRVKYLVEAEKRGVGTTNYVTRGANFEEIASNFRNRSSLKNLYGLFDRRDL